LVDHPGRRLKTPAAQRRVPIHSLLLAIGFAEYVAHVQAGGHEDLFPGLPPGGPDGKRSWHATKAFTRLCRRLGIDRPGLVFHSLRNTVAPALHEAGVPEVEAAALLGHQLETMSYGLYSGGLSLARLAAAVERITYLTRAGERLTAAHTVSASARALTSPGEHPGSPPGTADRGHMATMAMSEGPS
jgi:hypothetical protein